MVAMPDFHRGVLYRYRTGHENAERWKDIVVVVWDVGKLPCTDVKAVYLLSLGLLMVTTTATIMAMIMMMMTPRDGLVWRKNAVSRQTHR